MFDVLLDAVQNISGFGAPSSPQSTTAPIWISFVMVLGAAIFFIVLYTRYQKTLIKANEEREEFLVRSGRLDLKRKKFDAWGTLRPATCHEQSPPTPEQTHEIPKDENENEKKGVGEQLLETVTNGSIVHLLNNFHLKTKKMAKRFEPNMTLEERVQAERRAQLADESVNPLYPLRVKQQELDLEESSSVNENETETENVIQSNK